MENQLRCRSGAQIAKIFAKNRAFLRLFDVRR